MPAEGIERTFQNFKMEKVFVMKMGPFRSDFQHSPLQVWLCLSQSVRCGV